MKEYTPEEDYKLTPHKSRKERIVGIIILVSSIAVIAGLVVCKLLGFIETCGST